MPSTYSTVATRVRALLDENESPIVFTTVNQIPAIAAGLEMLQLDLALQGHGTLTKEFTATLPANTSVIPLPTGDAGIDGAFAVLLPEDLLIPLELYERGTAMEEWGDPVMAFGREIPYSPTAAQVIEGWAWQTNQIVLTPASGARIVRIRYERELPAVDDPNTRLPIPGSANAVTFATVALLEFSRGQTAFYDRMMVLYEKAKEQLAGLDILQQQTVQHVRRRYSES